MNTTKQIGVPPHLPHTTLKNLTFVKEDMQSSHQCLILTQEVKLLQDTPEQAIFYPCLSGFKLCVTMFIST